MSSDACRRCCRMAASALNLGKAEPYRTADDDGGDRQASQSQPPENRRPAPAAGAAPPQQVSVLAKKASFAALKASAMVERHPSFANGSSGFVVDSVGRIEEKWSLGKRAIGEGSYGQVYRAVGRNTNEVRAVKKVTKAQLKPAEIQRMGDEVAMMKVMDHPGILKLFATFEDRDNFFLVLEFCAGGELFDRLVQETSFSETKAAVLMEQIFRAIYYLHEKQVAHRDLKPENFLFMSEGPIDQTPMKLIDFGMAAVVSEEAPLTTKCGTPYYVAPEVLEGSYRETCDEWSGGILMYVMLCGYPPFNARTDKAILKKVHTGKFSFPPEDWKDISTSSQDLIRDLLNIKPTERCTAQAALGHEWVKKFSRSGPQVHARQMTNLMKNLKSFQSANKLKKATLHIMAKLANEEKIKSLRQVFVALDTSGDGKISVAELRAGLEQTGLLEDDDGLLDALKDIDSDGNGEIDYSEWIAATLESRQYLEYEVCRSAFNIFDKNGDGAISREELAEVLSDASIRGIVGDDPMAVINDIMRECDDDGNNSIDFEEFMRMMRTGAEPPGRPSRRSS